MMEKNMRPSRTLAKLRSGGIASCFKLNLADAQAVVRMTRFHPLLLDARRRVAEAAFAHGKFAGTVASPANLDELVALGYRFLSLGADVLGLSHYCQALMAAFTKCPVIGNISLYGDNAEKS